LDSVSTASVSHQTVPRIGGTTHFLLRRLHSLTGLIFGGYLVVHLIVNATLIQMGGVFQTQVNKIHDLPFLWAFEWGLIYLPILYHTVYGVWIIVTGQPNVHQYRYIRNIFYVLQRTSAVIIVLFMIFHVFSLKYGWFGATLTFDPHNASGTVARHMQASFILPWIVYPIGVLASCYHLANGLWTAGITWGLTISAGAQRRWGYICAAIGVVLSVLGFLALIAAARINWQPLV
jgi:succinate dehydrogenase / fumarate reductase cytochrome b subunit